MDGFDCSPDRPATCDGVDLAAVAAAEGTPLYVYSAAGIVARYRALDAALGSWPHRIHFAMKANSTLGVVRLLHAAGSAFDANSGGEIGVALRAALRVNPDIEADTHPGIATGGRAHKFGVPMGDARGIVREASTHDGLELVGIHAHVGSQITDLDSLGRTAAAVAGLAQRLQEDGVPLAHVDLGGGLGIAYDGAEAPSVDAYARLLVDAVRPTGLTLLVEPGRWIVGPTGALIATVVDVKPQADGRHFVVLDAGMSELLRPALYGSAHRLHLLQPRDGPAVTCDVVGPICETTDVVGLGQRMPLPRVGDRILVRDAGAYGAAMASNYNRHPLPAEALIADGAWTLIRRRQSVDEMMASEL